MARDRRDVLLEAGLALSSELALAPILQRIVELAAELTGARYGALGVLGPGGRIVEFVTTGVSAQERARIGDPPRGRGILGVLIQERKPLRLASIQADPRSIGFPPNHPAMGSFLGAPVIARGELFGNIYLTEKQDGLEFTEEDEQALVLLAAQAGLAVANARLFEESERRGRWLEAAREVTTAILAGAGTQEVLRLVAEPARDLVGAATAAVAVPSADGTLSVAAAVGVQAKQMLGMALPVGGSVSGAVIASGAPVVLEDASSDPSTYKPMVRLGSMGPAMFVPIAARGSVVGALVVANPLGNQPFSKDEVALVETFAGQASVALEYAQAREDLQRLALLEDRERIAKELHDGVIQSLFAVGMSLQGTALLAGDEDLTRRIENAVEELDRVIQDLRNYIFGLRPRILAAGSLDEALRQLTREFEDRTGVVAVAEVDPGAANNLASKAADLVQLAREALSNVGRHAGATTVRLSLYLDDGSGILVVDDDGKGFDPGAAEGRGNGLRNMRERVAALGASIDITSVQGEGTTLRVAIPL